MSYSRRSNIFYRYASQSCFRYRGSGSSSRSRSRSRSYDSSGVENPGNNLYVTGLSSRITKDELEKHFASEGEVVGVHLVVDPWTRESRGFGFVTMATLVDAERCIKYLDQSVLEGRVITVEKARRRRGRTPTPGRYLGYRTAHVRRRSPSYSPYYRSRYRSRSYSSERDRSYSPYDRRDRSYSPYDRRYRSLSRSPYSRYSRSPIRRYHHSYSSDSRSYSMDRSVSPYYHRRHRSMSHSVSPRRSPPRGRSSRRSYSRSVSPRPSWRSRRNYSRSYSPTERRSNKSPSCSVPSRRSKGRYSRESYSHSRSMSPYSRSASGSPAGS